MLYEFEVRHVLCPKHFTLKRDRIHQHSIRYRKNHRSKEWVWWKERKN